MADKDRVTSAGVARSVCAISGHHISCFIVDEKAQFLCVKCGMGLEEIRGSKAAEQPQTD